VPTTAPTQDAGLSFVVLRVWTVVAVMLAAWLGVWRRRSVVGPLRVAPDRPVWPLWVVFAGGAGGWVVLSSLVMGFQLSIRMRERGPGTAPDPNLLFTPADWA